MNCIQLDAGNWSNFDDLYDAVLQALQAQHWHGKNLNAIYDTIGEPGFIADPNGRINRLEPPYRIEVQNAAKLSKSVLDELIAMMTVFLQTREEQGIDIDFAIYGDDGRKLGFN